MFLAISADDIPHRGRAKGLRGLPIVDGGDNAAWDRTRAGRLKSMAGMTLVTPMAALNRPNSGKQEMSISPWADVVKIANLGDLSIKIAVAIQDALGGSGAAAGEDDGGGRIGGRVDRWRLRLASATPADFAERCCAPKLPCGQR